MTRRNIEVRRRWLHWRPRRQRSLDVDPSPLGGLVGDSLVVSLWVLGIIAVVAAYAVLVPLIVIAAEIVVVGLLAGIGLVGRVVFRRPWTVEAVDHDREMLVGAWQVQGFGPAGELAAHLQAVVDRGEDLPPPAEVRRLAASLADPTEPTWPST